MIEFTNCSKEMPFTLLKQIYLEAAHKNQPNIESMLISSLNAQNMEVNSRFVNIKFINNNELIFFSNYNSPKAIEFSSHNQIAVTCFWSTVNIQIRMKAKINKCSKDFNINYFSNRSRDKNALAISSMQSAKSHSYQAIKDKFHEVRSGPDLDICPKYWGGYIFKPYEVEFWEGHSFRVNKRDLYVNKKNVWEHCILEP
jgi:pyridoxamine 5'-phosphate oxidase